MSCQYKIRNYSIILLSLLLLQLLRRVFTMECSSTVHKRVDLRKRIQWGKKKSRLFNKQQHVVWIPKWNVNAVNLYWAANPNTRFFIFILFFFHFNVIHTQCAVHNEWIKWLEFPINFQCPAARVQHHQRWHAKLAHEIIKTYEKWYLFWIHQTIREIVITIEFVSMETIFFYAFAKWWSHQHCCRRCRLPFVSSLRIRSSLKYFDANRNLFFLIGFDLAVIWLRLQVKCACVFCTIQRQV